MTLINSNGWRRINYAILLPFYDRIVRPLRRHRKRAIAMARVQAGERVLLIGAGTGLDLEHLPAGARITAIDLAPGMIRRLEGRAKALGLAVDARVMDAQALEFADGSFDAVLLHLILGVVPDARRCAAEAARVLRAGGRAVVFDKFAPQKGALALALRLFDPLIAAAGTHINRPLERTLAESGLVEERSAPASLGGFFRIVVLRKRGGPGTGA